MSGALQQVLRRMQQDGRLAFLIGPGSEVYAPLTQEAAAAAGQDVAEFRRTFDATLDFQRWPSESAIQDRISDALEADRRARAQPPRRLLDLEAVKVLNMVKAWRDFDGPVPFPDEVRMRMDAVLMAAEVRDAETGGAKR